MKRDKQNSLNVARSNFGSTGGVPLKVREMYGDIMKTIGRYFYFLKLIKTRSLNIFFIEEFFFVVAIS